MDFDAYVYGYLTFHVQKYSPYFPATSIAVNIEPHRHAKILQLYPRKNQKQIYSPIRNLLLFLERRNLTFETLCKLDKEETDKDATELAFPAMKLEMPGPEMKFWVVLMTGER